MDKCKDDHNNMYHEEYKEKLRKEKEIFTGKLEAGEADTASTVSQSKASVKSIEK